MSVIAAALKELIAAGVTGDALVTAIANIENALKPVKSAAAIRQQRYRDNEPERNALRNVTVVTPVTEEIFPSDGFPHPSLTSFPTIKEKPPIGGKKKVSSRGSRLPANWELEQEEGEWAESQGLSGEEVEFQADKFKDYWLGSGKAKVDWKATWRNWIRTYIERKSNEIQPKKARY